MLERPAAVEGTTLEREARARRLWYHDIGLVDGLRTRFPEDYEINPVLRSVDRGSRSLLEWMAPRVSSELVGRSVLDIGCADGLFSFWAARGGASRVVGVERNRYNFDHAEWLAGALDFDNVEFLWGGIESHLPADPFDVVFCVGLIYHLVDPLGVLHRLRQRCRQKLVLASAIDLPDGDGSPMSRLDRYATGAHGVWSFNVPMVRQMLTTAGFELIEEHAPGSPNPDRYYAVASPGKFEDHHIFAERVDQEFPINIDRRRARVREVWRSLAERNRGPVALFGAGTHTPWLLKQVADIPGVEVSCVLDDRIAISETVAGLAVHRPPQIDPKQLSAVVLSSWHQTDALARRADELFGRSVEVIRVDG